MNGFVGAYPCDDIDLLGFMSVDQLGINTSVADIWGWTDPLTDKEYAVVGTRTGSAFVDISVPTIPVRIGSLPTHIGTGSLWRDVDVAGNWCFVGSEISGHGIQVFDLTRLRNVATPPVTFTEDAWFVAPPTAPVPSNCREAPPRDPCAWGCGHEGSERPIAEF